MDTKHPDSIYGQSANDDLNEESFEYIFDQLDSLNRTVSTVEQSTLRHEEKLDDMISILRSVQETQTEMSHTLARMLVRFRKQAYNRHKVEELVRCNKELAQALSKRLYSSEFKRKKIPFNEEAMEGVIHPSALPYVYLDSRPSEDEDDNLLLFGVKSNGLSVK